MNQKSERQAIGNQPIGTAKTRDLKKKNKANLRDLRDDMNCSNVHITGIPKGDGTETLKK